MPPTLYTLPYPTLPTQPNPILSYPTLPNIPYRGLPYIYTLPYRNLPYTPLLYPTLRCPSLLCYILHPAQPTQTLTSILLPGLNQCRTSLSPGATDPGVADPGRRGDEPPTLPYPIKPTLSTNPGRRWRVPNILA